MRYLEVFSALALMMTSLSVACGGSINAGASNKAIVADGKPKSVAIVVSNYNEDDLATICVYDLPNGKKDQLVNSEINPKPRWAFAIKYAPFVASKFVKFYEKAAIMNEAINYKNPKYTETKLMVLDNIEKALAETYRSKDGKSKASCQDYRTELDKAIQTLPKAWR